MTTLTFKPSNFSSFFCQTASDSTTCGKTHAIYELRIRPKRYSSMTAFNTTLKSTKLKGFATLPLNP